MFTVTVNIYNHQKMQPIQAELLFKCPVVGLNIHCKLSHICLTKHLVNVHKSPELANR